MTTTIRILVVSDFDLSSASRLADSPLLSSTNRSAHGRRSNISNISSSNINSNSSSDPLRERSIDLCVAINAGRQQQQQQQNGHRRGVCYDPRDELLPYYQGKQKRDRILRTAGESRRCRRTRAGPQTQTATTTPGRNRNGSNDPNYDYDYDHNYNYQYRYNGTVVEQLRGRSRLRAHAYHPDPFGKSNDNINSSASAIAGAIDPPASFRSIPIPVPLPPALQPRFHHDVGDGAVLVEEEAEIELSRGVSDGNGNGYGNGNGNGGDNAMAFHGHNDSDEDINRPFRNRDRRSGVGGPEEFAARLGLITAALAQLESIVCRVVYLCEDLHPAQRQRQRRDQRQDQRQRQTKTYRRLTSNSLDLAGRWLPLLEGLGIGGILGSEDPSASTTSTDRGDNNNNNNGNGNDEEDVRARCNKNLEAILRSAFPVSPPHGNSGNSDSDNETDGTEPTLFQSIVLNTGASRTVRNESQQQQQQQHEGQTPTSFSVGYRAASSSSPPSSSAFVRDHCVLEIAAWGAAPVAAPGGADKRLVVPGSLRRNGEFCLIDLVRSEHANGNDNGNDNDNANVKANAQRAASWEVARTQFCRLDDFEP
eukprot:jgi/Psemu1/26766/gm1.26766_g